MAWRWCWVMFLSSWRSASLCWWRHLLQLWSSCLWLSFTPLFRYIFPQHLNSPLKTNFDLFFFFFWEHYYVRVTEQELSSITVLLESSVCQNQPRWFSPPADIDVTHLHYESWESPPCWFRSLKPVLYFSIAGYRASTSPHPVSCGGWRPWAARPSTPISTRRCRAPASSGPLASNPGLFCRPMRGLTSIKPRTSLDLWPPGKMMCNDDDGLIHSHSFIAWLQFMM